MEFIRLYDHLSNLSRKGTLAPEVASILMSAAGAARSLQDTMACTTAHGLGKENGNKNKHGDSQKGIDIHANDLLIDALAKNGKVRACASEEIPFPHVFSGVKSPYLFTFDPYDGSGGYEVERPGGMIAAIFKTTTSKATTTERDFNLSGKQIVAACYSLHSARTSFVYATGSATYKATLVNQEWLVHPQPMNMPKEGKIYSANEANYDKWPQGTKDFVLWKKRQGSTQRYGGTLVGDVHQVLHEGGSFFYPSEKLRLLFEVFPMAFIAMCAGGKAINGKTDIHTMKAQTLHQRVPFIVGSPVDVDVHQSFLRS